MPDLPIPAARRTKIKNYLKAKGHPPGKINGLSMATEKQLRRQLAELHNVSESEWRAAGGQPWNE